ncbi:MAG TPA: hypothetical protein VK559_01875 [Ferruginibacter sp.]|nr:hypothetical protein [Ferruginibacter sp.]
MKISSNDILKELQELSPLLAGMEKVNVFTVPDGYFNDIPAAVLFALGKENNLPAFSGQSTFNVPAGYFESLAGNILAKIKEGELTVADELRELSAMLYSIQNENVYKVPNGYFDDLAESILKQVQPQQAKVIRIGKRNGVLKTAVAASVIVLLAFSVYKVDKNFGNTATIQVASLLDPSIQQGKNMGDAQFNATLDSLSTQEIANYLEKHNDDADVAALTSGLDANSIPNQDDYIVDDKTLDNYVQALNSSSSKN